MNINGRYGTVFSVKMDTFTREQIAEASERMMISDSAWTRIAIQTFLTKCANKPAHVW